jgi:hypothetical protein
MPGTVTEIHTLRVILSPDDVDVLAGQILPPI